MAKKRSAYTVTASGPEIDVAYEELGAALSRSVTEAQKRRFTPGVTVYVRDVNGDPVAYSEVLDKGVTATHLRAKR